MSTFSKRPEADRAGAVRYLAWLLGPVAAYERFRGRGESFPLKALHVHSEVDELVDAGFPEGGWTDKAQAHFGEECADVALSALDLTTWSNNLGAEGLLRAMEAKVAALKVRMGKETP